MRRLKKVQPGVLFRTPYSPLKAQPYLLILLTLDKNRQYRQNNRQIKYGFISSSDSWDHKSFYLVSGLPNDASVRASARPPGWLTLSTLSEHTAVRTHVPDTSWHQGHSLVVSPVRHFSVAPCGRPHFFLPSIYPPRIVPAQRTPAGQERLDE